MLSQFMLSHFSHAKSLQSLQFFGTPWTVAHQAPLSMGFSRQEYWSGLPCPSPEGLSDPGIEPTSLLHWQSSSLPLAPPGKHWSMVSFHLKSEMKVFTRVHTCSFLCLEWNEETHYSLKITLTPKCSPERKSFVQLEGNWTILKSGKVQAKLNHITRILTCITAKILIDIISQIIPLAHAGSIGVSGRPVDISQVEIYVHL